MENTVCPYCGHDRLTGMFAKGAATGAAVVGIGFVLNPVAGALAAGAVAVQKLLSSDDARVKCPQCGNMYSR